MIERGKENAFHIIIPLAEQCKCAPLLNPHNNLVRYVTIRINKQSKVNKSFLAEWELDLGPTALA